MSRDFAMIKPISLIAFLIYLETTRFNYWIDLSVFMIVCTIFSILRIYQEERNIDCFKKIEILFFGYLHSAIAFLFLGLTEKLQIYKNWNIIRSIMLLSLVVDFLWFLYREPKVMSRSYKNKESTLQRTKR
ncbi:hypothetical protein POG22_02895 [Geitlerinema sp. CS-897]|nr:hypothetical protein [Geitlerinema sp. CS-897]